MFLISLLAVEEDFPIGHLGEAFLLNQFKY